ncbi:MFS transporter [Cellulosimicrobium sp. Marseille-Q4280]|uniref:MFS transporter n=1 Tax=Cellulosimicrobium sp. Marseille-Q4280 TaxID=2937992 RepID=UPI00203F48FA|nr:MFS transporter [Cellulosimicrobium sp. Marseille-Q4280]
MSLTQRVQSAPMSRTQYAVVALCVAMNMLDGFDVLALAFSSSAIADEWQLSGGQLGVLLSSALLGMAIGSALVSQVADVIGRRTTVLACGAVITLGMALSAAATGYEMLLAVRVLTGLAIGTLQACLNVLVSEYASARHRPTAISFYTAGQPIGGTLGGILAGVLLATLGWRSVFAFGAVATGVLMLVVWRVLPESIDYLTSRRPPRALERLNAILARIGHPHVTELPAPAAARTTRARWSAVLMGRAGLVTLALGLAFFMLMAGFYFANSWTPQLIVLNGFLPGDGVQAGVMFSLGGIAGSLIFGPVASRVGVRPTLVAAFVLAGAAFAGYASSMGSLAVAFTLAAALGATTSAAMAGMFSVGPMSYDAATRATGVGLIIGLGRVGAIVSPIVAGRLLDTGWEPGQLYYLFVIPMLVGAAAIALLRRVPLATPDATVASPASTGQAVGTVTSTTSGGQP